MTTLFWSPEDAELKTFSSSSRKTAKGLETIIKIELSVKDPYTIGSVLRQLDEVSKEQEAAKKPPRKQPSPKSEPLALPAPTLQLTYAGDEQ